MKRFQPKKNRHRHNVFEGWYTRLVLAEGQGNLAIIMAYTTNREDPHAFIQVFDGMQKSNRYVRFPLDAYRYDGHTVWIDTNHLAPDSLRIDIDEHVLDVSFSSIQTLERSAMGFLAKFPLQCYQEIIMLGGSFSGRITTPTIDGEHRGTLYMEKTFGRRFPKRWFWLQANRFKGAALSMAGGHVPTLFHKPFGFFAIFQHGEQTHTFATYNRAKMNVTEHDDTVVFTLRRRRCRLTITATKSAPTALVGPADKGAMTLPVFETLNATVTVHLEENGTILYDGISPLGGFEWMMHSQSPNLTKET